MRDAKASASDLNAVLSSFIERRQGSGYAGALLFSCLGRGQDLYGHPNHDSDCFQQYLGRIPLAGFFCNGEIGPVSGMTHLHGYTSCFGIFRAKE
ncbi:MAG: hypothetical protein COT35_00495 [Nitrospirae bacterium CG08_land_8_20_14_0_20_52_24]|nr:MAG: hypothetical protein COT35_00495 [Nitrospirae bacterium CG08_land_8_20_14_0_20_52_24]PIV85628.1 MAG: hypothetical protein COW52_01245 [Nitrospirae bacterium CG17_big_fil_post_rev_8_21_14_2_50_50_9]PIX85029.1 MAG: hypothetical protein COZ32_10625 [Nitrospirae bacterium CG_4_10_14_3_um_filter_53_41]